MTDDSDDDEVELSRVSGPRFGTAGGHLDRDDDVISITSYTHVHIHSVSEKWANFETVQLKIIRIDFDDTWQNDSK